MPPIYQTSTYAQEAQESIKDLNIVELITLLEALEKSLASIESGNFAFAFGSGLAAMDAVLKTLKPGDEIISTDDLYGGPTDYLPKYSRILG